MEMLKSVDAVDAMLPLLEINPFGKESRDVPLCRGSEKRVGHAEVGAKLNTHSYKILCLEVSYERDRLWDGVGRNNVHRADQMERPPLV